MRRGERLVGRPSPTFNRFADGARDDYATGRSLGFEARRYVHALAVKVIAIDDQIAKVQADPEHDARVFRLVAVGFSHGLLECDSGVQCIHSAWELDQRTVARQLDQSPSVARKRRFKTLGAMSLQASDGAGLVVAYQA